MGIAKVFHLLCTHGYHCFTPQPCSSLWVLVLALYSGLLTPEFVACRTNAGGRPGKTESHTMTYWMCGGVAHSFCIAEPKCLQDCLMSSAQSFYDPCLRSVVQSQFSGSVPLLHMSRYVIAHNWVLPGLPCINTASDKWLG